MYIVLFHILSLIVRAVHWLGLVLWDPGYSLCHGMVHVLCERHPKLLQLHKEPSGLFVCGEKCIRHAGFVVQGLADVLVVGLFHSGIYTYI